MRKTEENIKRKEQEQIRIQKKQKINDKLGEEEETNKQINKEERNKQTNKQTNKQRRKKERKSEEEKEGSLFIAGLQPRQPYRVISGLYKTCTLHQHKTYEHNPKVSPFGIIALIKNGNKVRRCWYH